MDCGNRSGEESTVGNERCNSSRNSSITDVTRLNQGTHTSGPACDGLYAPPDFDARTLRDMSRGLLRRLLDFDRSVRRLDGGQDAATDYANARLVLEGGVEESINAIDNAREAGIPYTNLAETVDRCRVALDNVRDQPNAVPPLPLDEGIIALTDNSPSSGATRYALAAPPAMRPRTSRRLPGRSTLHRFPYLTPLMVRYRNWLKPVKP